MHISWREFLATPINIIIDYITVVEGESLAAGRAPGGKQTTISDAPAGYELDQAEPELLSFKAPEN